jgi:hypothetical protein
VACGIRGIEIDNQANDCQRLYFDFPDANAMDLDHAGQRLGRPHDQTP